MTKYNRPNGKLFGSSASNIGVFGSGQTGETPTTSTDPDAINTLGTHWEEGWDGAVVSQAPYTAPFVEDMNAVNYVNSYNSAYLLQKGIPEYSKTADYYKDSVCTYNGSIYICLQDNPAINTDPDDPDPDAPPINYDPTYTSYWNERVELPDMQDNEILVGDTGNGATVTGTLNQGDILASTTGLDVKAGVITNTHISSQAGDKIAESKLDLAYSTSTLNTNIGNVSSDLNTHTTNSNNPHSTTLANLVGNNLSTPNDQDTLVYDNVSSKWINQENSLDNLSNATITTPSNKDVLWYSGGSWVNTSDVNNHMVSKANPHETKVANLNDANASTPSDQDVLVYDGNSSKWINQPNTVENLQNTNISTVSDGQILSYDSGNSEWVNTTNSIDNLSDTNISGANYGDTLFYDGNDWINQENSVDNLSNTNISSASTGDVLTYDGLDWINQQNSVENLSDVNITSVADGDTLVYDANSSTWINSQGGGGGGGDSRFANVSGSYLTDVKRYLGVTKKPSIVKTGSYIRLYFYKDDIVIAPNGTETTLSADVYLDITNLSLSDEFFIFYSPSTNELLYSTRANMVEKNTEPAFSTSTVWYNYNTKVMKAGKGATSWSDTAYVDLTVPLCIIKNQKIIELFDYFGSYFLRYYFLFPNTKYLRPNGRNADGTFNNSEVSMNSGNMYINQSNSYYKGNKYPVIAFANGSSSNMADFPYKFVYVDDEIPAGYNVGVFQNSMYGFQNIFSYVDNRWYYMSSGTPMKASFDILIYVTLDASVGNIIKLDKPPLLMQQNKIADNRKVKDESLYYATNYAMDRSPSSSNVILNANDNRNIMIETASTCNIVLPCVAIKKGDSYSFTFINNPSGNVVIQSFARNTITTVTTSGGSTEYIFVAKCDLPASSSDWYGYKKSITSV